MGKPALLGVVVLCCEAASAANRFVMSKVTLDSSEGTKVYTRLEKE